MISLEHTIQIFQNIPQAALWVMPCAGHATLIDQKDNFNKIVDNFFSKTFRARK